MKMKKTKKTIAGILAVILAAGTILTGCQKSTAPDDAAKSKDQETQTITIKAATGGSPKPYIYVDEENQPAGYDIEVLKEVFDRLPQYELTFEVTDFSPVFTGLNSGSYQIGVNNFSYNKERGESYLYSYPYDKIGYVFVTKKGAEPISSFEEAAGKSFEGSAGVSVTTAVEAWNEKNPDETIGITYTDSDTAVLLQHIEDGTVDFGIIDVAMYNEYQKEYSFDVVGTEIPEDEAKQIADNTYAYYIFPKDQGELRDAVNGVLKELQADGTLTELSEKWFGQDTAPEAERFEETIN